LDLRLVNTAEYPLLEAIVKRPSIHPIYKLMSGTELRDIQIEERERRKNEKVVHQKVLQLTSSATDHDIMTKIKHAAAWLEKGDEVRVLILGRVDTKSRMTDIHQLVLKELKSLYKPTIPDLGKTDKNIKFRLLPVYVPGDEVRMKDRDLDHAKDKTKEEVDSTNLQKENIELHQPH